MILSDLPPGWAALAGALAGGLIAELHAVLQGSRERRRAIRVLLYRLLELRLELRDRDVTQVAAVFLAYIQKRFGIAVDQTTFLVDPVMQQVLQAMLKAVTPTPIAAPYASAIADLAPHAPLLAYRLGGADRCRSMDGHVGEYFASILGIPEIAADPLTPTVGPKAPAAIIRIAQSEALAELAHKIRLVAGPLWTVRRLQVEQIIRRQDKPPEVSIEIERRLEQLLLELSIPIPDRPIDAT